MYKVDATTDAGYCVDPAEVVPAKLMDKMVRMMIDLAIPKLAFPWRGHTITVERVD